MGPFKCVITPIMKYGMKLLIHSHKSTIASLKFGKLISYFIPMLYWVCDYLHILWLKLIHVSERDPAELWKSLQVTKHKMIEKLFWIEKCGGK